MELNLSSRALEKLMDHVASGIGSGAGYVLAPLAPWRAGREAEARRILASGEADAMKTIATAQAEARQILESPDSSLQMEVDISQSVTQRMRFQEEKRQRNITSVVQKATEELGGKQVDDGETNHDWTARFFNYVQDISSEEMQLLWARVLAGEVERSGSTSVQALSILRNLDQATAGLFQNLCSICVSDRPDGSHVLDARAPTMGRDTGGSALRDYGLDFGNLSVLNEHGLIIADLNSWRDYSRSIGFELPDSNLGVIRMPFYFQGGYWVLLPTRKRSLSEEFRLSGVALTRAGRELSCIVDTKPMNQYHSDLTAFFGRSHLRLSQSLSHEPQLSSDNAER